MLTILFGEQNPSMCEIISTCLKIMYLLCECKREKWWAVVSVPQKLNLEADLQHALYFSCASSNKQGQTHQCWFQVAINRFLSQASLKMLAHFHVLSPPDSEIRGILNTFMTSGSCPFVIYGDFFPLWIILQLLLFESVPVFYKYLLSEWSGFLN